MPNPETFEAAADAIVNGDIVRLRQLMAEHPDLIHARSTRDHHSTLLHYVSANGVEDDRQKTPGNIVEIARLLLDAGAEVDAHSDAYGGGSTTLGLAATSIHPQKAGVQLDLLQTLLDHGASLQHSSAGNNHAIVLGCLANGQPEAARFLASKGAPLDVESAAGLNRLDDLMQYAPQAKAEQLESALLYACGYGAPDAVRYLLDQGVNPGVKDAQDQTALHWATWTPHPDIIRVLLDGGASIKAKERRFQATPLDNVLWAWHNGSGTDCYEAAALLAEAGATVDPNHWDAAMLEKIADDPRMAAALTRDAGPLPRGNELR
jgi:ankyrin repeat protein